MERKRRADDGDRDFVMKPRFLRPGSFYAEFIDAKLS